MAAELVRPDGRAWHHFLTRWLHPEPGEELAEARQLWLGMFSHVLHIRPWEIGDLPVAEFRLLVSWLEEFNRRETDQGE